MNQKNPPKTRERALRTLDETKPDHENLMSAVRHASSLLRMSAEAL